MANKEFSFENSGFDGVQDKFSSSDIRWEGMDEVVNGGKQFHFKEEESWGESGGNNIDYLHSGVGFNQQDSSEQGFPFSKYQQQEQQQESFSDYALFDDLQFNILSPPLQTCLEEITKVGENEVPTLIPDDDPKKEKQYSFSLASLELLNNYGSKLKRLNGDRIIEASNDTTCTKVVGRELSTEEIMRIAGAKFIQSPSPATDGLFMLSHPFDSSFYGLSYEETKDVELAEFLLASAEKVGCQQYDRASKLLHQCDSLSSDSGNPVQRVVFYFSEALREKIERETGRIMLNGWRKRPSFNVEELIMKPNPIVLACHKGLPFYQVAQFAGIQAIVENMAEAKKIHIIDLCVRNGVQWTILMQALVSRYECPIELLRITVVGTNSKQAIEATGKRLESFAQSMGLPFSFKIVMVSDRLDLKEDDFELDSDETVAVYSEYLLRNMIPWPNQMESVMRVIRSINPRVMVVTEVEANHNSPVFVNRFIEALFYFSAFFDCLETFMKRDDPNRLTTESLYFGEGIRSIVAAEGEERKIRNVKIDVWRAFFDRFGMVETEMSRSFLYQASLVVKKFACGSSCTLDMNGKCLIIGWKGTPITSLSVWKFL